MSYRQADTKQDFSALFDTSAGIARQLEITSSRANGILVYTAEATATVADLGRMLVSLTDTAVSGLAAINGSVSSVGEQLEVQMQRTRGEAATTGAWLIRAVSAAIFGGGCRRAGE